MSCVIPALIKTDLIIIFSNLFPGTCPTFHCYIHLLPLVLNRTPMPLHLWSLYTPNIPNDGSTFLDQVSEQPCSRNCWELHYILQQAQQLSFCFKGFIQHSSDTFSGRNELVLQWGWKCTMTDSLKYAALNKVRTLLSYTTRHSFQPQKLSMTLHDPFPGHATVIIQHCSPK